MNGHKIMKIIFVSYIFCIFLKGLNVKYLYIIILLIVIICI